MKVSVVNNGVPEIRILSESSDDLFLLGKLAVKMPRAQVFPRDGGKELHCDARDLVLLAAEGRVS